MGELGGDKVSWEEVGGEGGGEGAMGIVRYRLDVGVMSGVGEERDGRDGRDMGGDE